MEVFSGDTLSAFAFTCIALGCSIVSGVVAFLLAGAAEPLRLVSRHRRERFSTRRVALTGGVGLFAGVVAAMLVLRTAPAMGWVVAAAGFFVVGLLDDAFELKPLLKFALQGGVAASAAVLLAPAAYMGMLFVLFLVLVNASNYLDNMDGLLAGVALTQAFALLFFSTVTPTGALLLIWALPGVFFLTLPPARLYLGDSGSHFIGALLAADAGAFLIDAQGLQTRYVFPLLLAFAVPLADAATVTVSRLRRKRPVFRGGTDHLSHRLVRIGFPVPRAVLILVIASAVCGFSALLVLRS